MNRKMAVIGGAALALGTLSIAFSSTLRTTQERPRVKAQVAAPATAQPAAVSYADPAAATIAPAEAMAPAAVTTGQLELVEPSPNLPRALSQAMVTSVSPMAPTQAVAAAGSASSKGAKVSGKSAKAGKAVDGMAAAAKPKKLFSYVRMLEFNPHPTEEEFLRDKPLQLFGRNYHFTVSYNEKWEAVGEENGALKKLGFEINLLENGKPCRNLKIPPTTIDAKTLRKGMVLGLAQVAPYNFRIVVDSFKLKGKNVSELVFKFDLTG